MLIVSVSKDHAFSGSSNEATESNHESVFQDSSTRRSVTLCDDHPTWGVYGRERIT